MIGKLKLTKKIVCRLASSLLWKLTVAVTKRRQMSKIENVKKKCTTAIVK